MKSLLIAPGTKRLKLIYDGLVSNVAFNLNLRRYSVGQRQPRGVRVGVSDRPAPVRPAATIPPER